MKKELEELRKEFNDRIDKLIKPQFEVGKWYKGKHRHDNYLWFAKECDKDDLTWIRGYGFTNSEYSEAHSLRITEFNFMPATPKEVQEALEKEAAKNKLVKGAKIKSSNGTICIIGNERHGLIEDKSEFYFYKKDDNELWAYAEPFNICIFQNGQWATIIQEMTIDELALKLSYTTSSEVLYYLKQNKQQIIETLTKIK